MEVFSLAFPSQPNIFPADAVILFGCFDGVHPGHLALLEEAKRIAAGRHPVAVWVIDRGAPDCLTTREEKCRIFALHGADFLAEEPFPQICSLSGEEFFTRHVLPHRPHALVCGFNFRFGVKASCGAEDLKKMAAEHDVLCSVVPAMNDSGITVSSTAVRNAVHAGDLVTAAHLLGRPLSYTSEIRHGKQLGRTIGHPTINQRIPELKIAPPRGVYSCVCTFVLDGESVTRGGVCNIGSRPTVNDDTSDVTLETYLFDFSGDLYGTVVTTSLIERIRGEKRFDSVDALREQIGLDGEDARVSLKKRGYGE